MTPVPRPPSPDPRPRAAVIPAAGFGTRFLPWTKAVPKELLPLGAKPVLQYVLEEALDAGITEVVLVISKGKEAIQRYFEPDPVLERWVEGKGMAPLLADLKRVQDGIHFRYVFQEEMKGLGDAVRVGAEALSADTPFAVLLGDTVIAGESPLGAMFAELERDGLSSVAVQEVPPERATAYGVCGGHESAPDCFEIARMEEKPAADRIPRMRRLDGREVCMAFAARYVFTPELTHQLKETPPGRNGEIQLTDAMDTLLRRQGHRARLLRGRRLDIGRPEGLAEAWKVLQEVRV